MNINITDLLVAVLTIVAALVSAKLIPWLKTQVDDSKFNTIQMWVRIGVTAAEQIWTQSGAGAEKKAFVLQFLKNHNIDLDTEVLSNMIESAVYDIKSWGVAEE